MTSEMTLHSASSSPEGQENDDLRPDLFLRHALGDEQDVVNGRTNGLFVGRGDEAPEIQTYPGWVLACLSPAKGAGVQKFIFRGREFSLLDTAFPAKNEWAAYWQNLGQGLCRDGHSTSKASGR